MTWKNVQPPEELSGGISADVDFFGSVSAAKAVGLAPNRSGSSWKLEVILVLMALAAATWATECRASRTRGETTACAPHAREIARYSAQEYTCLRRRFEPYAAQFGEDDVIRVLLAHGANIEQRNDYRLNRAPENHETALASAVHNGDVAGVYLLLTRGASVSAVSEPPYDCGARPLATLKLLIAYGAKTSSACEIGGHTQ